MAQQPGLVGNIGPVAAGRVQRQFERCRDIPSFHGGTQLPGNDVAGIVVEDGRQVEPAPPCDLEIGKVRLPELVRRRRLVPERIGRLDNDEGRTGDQIMSLQDPIDGGFGDKVTLRVGEPDRQLPRR